MLFLHYAYTALVFTCTVLPVRMCVCALHALVLHIHCARIVKFSFVMYCLLNSLLHTNPVRVSNCQFYVIDCCSPRGQCGVLPEQAVGGRRGQPIGAGVSGATEGPDLSCHDHHQGGSRGNHHQVRTTGLGRT